MNLERNGFSVVLCVMEGDTCESISNLHSKLGEVGIENTKRAKWFYVMYMFIHANIHETVIIVTESCQTHKYSTENSYNNVGNL